jgi:hypothetical protein
LLEIKKDASFGSQSDLTNVSANAASPRVKRQGSRCDEVKRQAPEFPRKQWQE